jgi:hypothetical protein
MIAFLGGGILKNKIISAVTVIVLLVAVIIAVKMGNIQIFNRDTGADIADRAVNDYASDTQEHEDYTLDKLVILNTGDEGDYERSGNVANLHFRFKYIEYNITKNKPDGIEIDFYKQGEEQVDNKGDFTDDTYYVTVKYEVTNLGTQSEDSNFSPQTFGLGYYDENAFTVKCEPRGHLIEGTLSVKGNVNIEAGETVTITTCYCVKEDVLKKGNIAVQASVTQERKAIKMPYFAINTDGEFE